MKKMILLVTAFVILSTSSTLCYASTANSHSYNVSLSEDNQYDLQESANDILSIFVETETLGAEINSRHTGKTPFYGKSADYTKKQNVTKRDLKFDNKIRTYTAAALALLMAAVTGGITYKDCAGVIIGYYISINSNSKNLYYTKVRYGHKKMPGIYHKYVITWYEDKARKKQVGKKSVYYDANM